MVEPLLVVDGAFLLEGVKSDTYIPWIPLISEPFCFNSAVTLTGRKLTPVSIFTGEVQRFLASYSQTFNVHVVSWLLLHYCNNKWRIYQLYFL